MVTPFGIVLVVFGIFVCFMGYSIFRSMLPLWGFILGGAIVYLVIVQFIKVPAQQQLIVQIVGFIVGGVIGALISGPLYYVVVFLSGAAGGALLGAILGAYMDFSTGTISMRALTELANMPFPPQVNTPLQLIMMVVLGLIIGGFSISFQKFMISASTAFLGAAAVVSGFSGTILTAMRTNPSRGLWIVFAWGLLAFIGLFIQFRLRDEV